MQQPFRKPPIGGGGSYPISPGAKIIHIAKKLGAKSIAEEQLTSRTIYDTLPIDGRSEFNFFERADTRSFPFTNLGSSGKLNVGETLGILRAYFTVITLDVGGNIITVNPLTPGTFPSLVSSDLNVEIAEQRPIKEISGISFLPQFNKKAWSNENYVFHFDNPIVIMPLIEFKGVYRTPGQAAVADTYLRLTLEGLGTIINTKTNL